MGEYRIIKIGKFIVKEVKPNSLENSRVEIKETKTGKEKIIAALLTLKESRVVIVKQYEKTPPEVMREAFNML